MPFVYVMVQGMVGFVNAMMSCMGQCTRDQSRFTFGVVSDGDPSEGYYYREDQSRDESFHSMRGTWRRQSKSPSTESI